MVDFMDVFNQALKSGHPNPFVGQFDLTPDQSARAMEAMMPMIAAILQRQLSDPQATARWLTFLAAMPATKIEPSDAATKAAAKLFGSPEIADALAEQISATSGVAQAVAKSMLPWASAMLVGGLAAANAKPGSSIDEVAEAMKPVLSTIPNPFGPKSFADDTWGEFVRGYNRGRPEKPPAPELTDAEKLLAQMVEAGRQAHAAQAEAFDKLLDGWFGRG